MLEMWLHSTLLATCLVLCALPATADEARLADAAERQDADAAPDLRDLLDRGADVNASQADGMTALHWAVYHDDAELAQRLIAAGANAQAQNRYGVTPLSIACQNGNRAIVEALLDAGADPLAALRGGETPLMTASRTGRLGPVAALLAHGAKVDAKDRKGQTALMWAAAEGHLEVVNALIEAQADFRTPLPSGFTPLLFAVREGRSEVVLRLIEAGIDVNEAADPERAAGNGLREGTSPLILATLNGHFELAAALLDAGADPNDNRCGYTALHAITWVRKPLRGDGDPAPIGSGNMSSLALVRKLVAEGADVNSRHGSQSSGPSGLNRNGATPFVLAAETGDIPLLRLLLELGADPELANADRSTPLLAAAGVGVLGNGDETAGTEEEALATIELLLEQGADLNAVDSAGNSAMHGAAYKSWTKVIAYLAERGADVKVWDRKNKRGWTPLLIAEGHRPGNFRPSPATIEAVRRAMQ